MGAPVIISPLRWRAYHSDNAVLRPASTIKKMFGSSFFHIRIQVVGSTGSRLGVVGNGVMQRCSFSFLKPCFNSFPDQDGCGSSGAFCFCFETSMDIGRKGNVHIVERC